MFAGFGRRLRCHRVRRNTRRASFLRFPRRTHRVNCWVAPWSYSCNQAPYKTRSDSGTSDRYRYFGSSGFGQRGRVWFHRNTMSNTDVRESQEGMICRVLDFQTCLRRLYSVNHMGIVIHNYSPSRMMVTDLTMSYQCYPEIMESHGHNRITSSYLRMAGLVYGSSDETDMLENTTGDCRVSKLFTLNQIPYEY